jgi:hypothetical protein
MAACVQQITDVVVIEPSHVGAAPAPAIIATLDASGNVSQIVVNPEDVDQVCARASQSSRLHRSAAASRAAPQRFQILMEVLGISGAPAPAGACPSICLAAQACRASLEQLCGVSGGSFCLSAEVCPMPKFCAVCTTGS